jgi:hypothetical protein
LKPYFSFSIINNIVRSYSSLAREVFPDGERRQEGSGHRRQGKLCNSRSVINLFFPLRPSNSYSAFTLLGVKETGVAIQQVLNQVGDLNRELSPKLITADHKSSSSLTGNELRKDLRKWIAPPDPSVNFNTASDAHQEGTAAWCTKGNTVVAWKASGSLLWIHGKRTCPIQFTLGARLLTDDVFK